MRIRNVHYDSLRVPDLDNLVIQPGEVVEVEDKIAWSLCRGIVVEEDGLRPPYNWGRFEPLDDGAMATFEHLEAMERRRRFGMATAKKIEKKRVLEVRCPNLGCERWLIRASYDGLILEWATSTTVEGDEPGQVIRTGDTVHDRKCGMRFRVVIPTL